MMEFEDEEYVRMIQGVTVHFPMQPYQCQKEIMRSVILAFKYDEHCLLESPAGSGKTLALLCSTLAFQRATYEKVTIYYATRTHGQIQHVVEELKRTFYRNTKMVVLGSKDRTCIQTMKGNKDEVCHNLRKSQDGCQYYSNKGEINTHGALKCGGIDGPWDIEDLKKLGKKHEACPYYAAVDLAEKANIIFCPYNYLLDPRIRESLPQIDTNGAIVIFDEGHNIDDSCRAAGSIYVSVQQLMNVKNDPSSDENVRAYCYRFIRFIKDPKTSNLMGQKLVDKMNEFDILRDDPSRDEFVEPEDPTDSFATERLAKTLKFARRMIREHGLDYGAIVRDTSYQPCVLKLVCLNPAVIFKPVAKTARNVIVASSSIYSKEKFANELGVKFPNRKFSFPLEKSNRLFVTTLGQGPRNNIVNAATWELRNHFDTQKITAGEILLNVCEIVPDGILCFFPSYDVKKCVINAWKTSGPGQYGLNLWDHISMIKYIYEETRETDVKVFMDKFRECITAVSMASANDTGESQSGFLLLAVHRGKFSEGINFSDNLARAIVSVGLPLAQRDDLEINMKFSYNDSKSGEDQLPDGEGWYRINAFNALNPSIGRCMGHGNDWGCILLLNQTMLGERLTDETYQRFLPRWLRAKARIESDYNTLKTDLKKFCTKQLQRDSMED